ncbi:MAG: hypothetical protein ACLKAM_12430, partial [Alkaliphilus sp.]
DKNKIKSMYGLRGFGIFSLILVCFLPEYIVRGLPYQMHEIENVATLVSTIIVMAFKSLQMSLPIVLIALAIAVFTYRGLKLKGGKIEIKKFIRNSLTVINYIYLTILILVYPQQIKSEFGLLFAGIVVCVLAFFLARGLKTAEIDNKKD